MMMMMMMLPSSLINKEVCASAVLAPPPAAPVKLSLRSKRGESGRPRLVPPAPLAAANFADEGLVSTALN